MYDKGNNLRIEVTINNPKDFKILKEKRVDNGKIVQAKKWVPMGKSIANLYRYVEICKSITKRYVEALPEIDMDKVPSKEIQSISEPKEINKRRYSGFNLLSKETIEIFVAIAYGGFTISGFDNKSIRKLIYEDCNNPKIINKTTRILSKLKAHGIIKKVPRKSVLLNLLWQKS